MQILLFLEALGNITATTVRELQTFVEQGLPIRNLPKRKYRLAGRRIKDATEQFGRNQNVQEFLSMVSYCVQQLVRQNLELDAEPVIEEQILAPLRGDVPPEFRTLISKYKQIVVGFLINKRIGENKSD